MSDSSLPTDFEDLPDLPHPGDALSEPEDRVLLLQDLIQENGGAMNELSQQGVALNDAHSLISNMILQSFLEEILRRLAGEAAVVDVGITVHRQIGPLLAQARSQLSSAKTRGSLLAPGPVHDGRVTR